MAEFKNSAIVWVAEVETIFPIAILKLRFLYLKYIGQFSEKKKDI